MLNFIYTPISWILWAWHTAFVKLFSAMGIDVAGNPNVSGLAWALGIVFLTVTVRLILLYPMVKQIHTTQKMQELQPQIQALQKKYKNDRQRLSVEMSKLQKDNGVNMMMGCLPMFVQIPIFIGLFHVLRMFNKMGSGNGGLGFTAAQTRNSSNYFFGPEEVRSFLDARLFGAPLSGYISQSKDQYAAFFPLGTYSPADNHRLFVAILSVAIPLLIISAVATHMNARASIRRQTPSAAAATQANIMNKMMLWFFPLMILGTGVLWHIGLLVYMVTNNIWTFFQQLIIFHQMDKRKEKEQQKAQEAQKATAPRPGVKPRRGKKGAKAAAAGAASAVAVEDAAAGDVAGVAGSAKGAGTAAGGDGAAADGVSSSAAATGSQKGSDAGNSAFSSSDGANANLGEKERRQQAQRARQQSKNKSGQRKKSGTKPGKNKPTGKKKKK